MTKSAPVTRPNTRLVATRPRLLHLSTDRLGAADVPTEMELELAAAVAAPEALEPGVEAPVAAPEGDVASVVATVAPVALADEAEPASLVGVAVGLSVTIVRLGVPPSPVPDDAPIDDAAEDVETILNVSFADDVETVDAVVAVPTPPSPPPPVAVADAADDDDTAPVVPVLSPF